jgi:uncharacterized protein
MIKLLLLIAIVFVVIWFVRGGRSVGRSSGRNEDEARRAGGQPQPPAPQDMVECPVCRVHLPRIDALPGPDGQLYCCAEHRQRAAG